MNEITCILECARRGESKAPEELLPLVYGQLRNLAMYKMARESPGQTLQPTALVHEAWLRLVDAGHRSWESKGHFFAAAAEAMRRILVERARSKQRFRHGGGKVRVELEDADLGIVPNPDEKVLLVHEVLDELAREDPLEAEVVKLRFFGGLKHAEIAKLLGLSEKTVRRYWTHAKAWLYARIRESAD